MMQERAKQLILNFVDDVVSMIKLCEPATQFQTCSIRMDECGRATVNIVSKPTDCQNLVSFMLTESVGLVWYIAKNIYYVSTGGI